MADYHIALAEVNEILNHIEIKYIQKIPRDILKIIRSSELENIDFKYDLTKTLLEQNIQRETLEILSYLNYNFWIKESEKNKFDKMYYDNFIKIEDEKRAKYNPDDLFKNKNYNKYNNEELLPMVYEKKVGFFKKIIDKIKAIIK